MSDSMRPSANEPEDENRCFCGLVIPTGTSCTACGRQYDFATRRWIRVPQINPLALTDADLDEIYKAITATEIRGGVTVEKRKPQPGDLGKGKNFLGYRVTLAPGRVGGGSTLAHTGTVLEAEVIAHAFNHLAFLIESLRSERKVANGAARELGCVAAVLDAHQVSTEMAPDTPLSLHGRVAHALDNQCIIGQYCSRHQFIHGAEAEELRQRVEKMAKSGEPVEATDLMLMLDDVDARDSLAYLEHKQDQQETS